MACCRPEGPDAGALSNAPGRYEGRALARFDDGWEGEEERWSARVREERRAVCDHLQPVARFALRPFGEPYRGCEHGCTYCFARPTHAYLNCRRGWISRRTDCATGIGAVLTRELRRRPIACADRDRDEYGPLSALRGGVARDARGGGGSGGCDHPLAITTKGTLIERDRIWTCGADGGEGALGGWGCR